MHSELSGGPTSDMLKWVTAPVIPNSKCKESYNGEGKISEVNICAGFPGVGGKDACQGDSGGPLVCQNGTSAVITGIVSWGYGCAEANYPGVYARVTSALNWIKLSMVRFNFKIQCRKHTQIFPPKH